MCPLLFTMFLFYSFITDAVVVVVSLGCCRCDQFNFMATACFPPFPQQQFCFVCLTFFFKCCCWYFGSFGSTRKIYIHIKLDKWKLSSIRMVSMVLWMLASQLNDQWNRKNHFLFKQLICNAYHRNTQIKSNQIKLVPLTIFSLSLSPPWFSSMLVCRFRFA